MLRNRAITYFEWFLRWLADHILVLDSSKRISLYYYIHFKITYIIYP